MPRGVSSKREKEYRKLVEKFHDSEKYKGREEEVAARIVNKQRTELGETKEAKKEDAEGQSPDRHLPLKNYDNLTVDQITKQIESLSHKEIEQLKTYEQKHGNRKSLLNKLETK